ncbi:uncharacterized protein LOC123320116 isoform X2 [Coccinella septempunctata]|uniref:uncharacterized protein LOC123320116 isoform X2 n=1 Tax=Coccinella septempunctata TaxID=41139 RepID=UPI001D073A94|nr:uncharacterized protein LOC123320116 isoform X2 [Coccinella septempunctata]
MSRYQSRNTITELENQSACAKCWKITWKTITCIFSHVTLITLVVTYCTAGAFTFEALEVDYEKQVKRSIKGIRQNVTNHLWHLALESKVLDEVSFTKNASSLIQNFEGALVKAMTKDGWDGEEDENIVQWTRTGSLFYSIIVITTIGYGHITPKTALGKVVTIFYAILGIPLMLLCLSNIGDIMATSFRFLYWRVCCYVCTRPKKPRRSRSIRGSVRSAERFSRSRNASFRRSVRNSTRSADSGYGNLDMHTSHSDTDLSRYHEYTRQGGNLQRNQPSRFSDERRGQSAPRFGARGGSLDRKKFQNRHQRTREFEALEMQAFDKTPILCNKYVVKEGELNGGDPPGITVRDLDNERRGRSKQHPSTSEKDPNHLQIPVEDHLGDDQEEQHHARKKRLSPRLNSSPKMMTPLGYGYRSKYLDDPDSDEDFFYDDVYYDTEKHRTRPVPIGLCVFLVMSYIVGGAFLFDYWEQWGLLNAAYFCFITLTTIGFGDLVPAKGVSQDTNETTTTVTVSIALCSLYLLFGIALLAMSFNLVQEEVITNVKSLAKTLGIIKSDDEDESDLDDV